MHRAQIDAEIAACWTELRALGVSAEESKALTSLDTMGRKLADDLGVIYARFQTRFSWQAGELQGTFSDHNTNDPWIKVTTHNGYVLITMSNNLDKPSSNPITIIATLGDANAMVHGTAGAYGGTGTVMQAHEYVKQNIDSIAQNSEKKKFFLSFSAFVETLIRGLWRLPNS